MEIFEPHARKRKEGLMLDELPQHQGDVLRAGVLRFPRKPRAIGKQRIRRPQLARPLVHALHEGLFAARKPFGDRHTRIIRRTDGDALQKFPHGIGEPRIEKDLRTAHTRRMFADFDLLVQLQFALVHRLKGKEQRHHLAHARDGQMFRLRLGGNGRAAVRIAHIDRLRPGLYGRGIPQAAKRRKHARRRDRQFLHAPIL